MANIQERVNKDGSVRYRVQIRMKGYPLVSATFKRKTDAQKWATQEEAAMYEGRHFKTTEAKKHTVAEMIDRYMEHVLPQKREKSRRTQASQLLWWKQKLGHHVLADVMPAMIAELRDQLANTTTCRVTTRSPATVVRYLAVLSHCYTMAVKEWQWVEDNPVLKVKKPREPRGRIRCLSEEELNRLLEVCKKSPSRFLYPIVMIAVSTGMRFGEILNLKWEDVDLGRSLLFIHDTKNNERRSVSISSHVMPVFRNLRDNQVRRIDTPYVFPAPYRPARPPQPIDIRSAWRTAVKQSGIEDFKFHDLRHTAASYLAMSGATIVDIAAVLGHKTLEMVKRYSHISEPHTAQVVERMNEKIFGK